MVYRSLLFSEPPKNILIRMPNWLGDFVMASPILTDLRHHWPEAKITVVCQGTLSAVIQEDPHIDHLIDYHRFKELVRQKGKINTSINFPNDAFDLGILLTNSFSSAFWFWRASVRHKLGYAAHWRHLLLDHPIHFPKMRNRQHLVITYKMLLEPLGIPVSITAPKLYMTSAEQLTAKEKFKTHGIHSNDILIGINPGAAYGSAKCWLPERFKQLSRQLLENPKIHIVFFGDKGGAPLVDEICSDLDSERVINLAGKTTLREFFALIQECHLFLTNDSGPMHVASALGVPLIALFGSTSDATTGPYQGGKVIHKHVPCSPCYRRECPIDFRCMNRIEVSEVYHEIFRILNPHK